jgi:hypothetical protein
MKPEGSLQVHKWPSPDPILSQMNPVHSSTSYIIQIPHYINLPLMPFKRLSFPTKNVQTFLISPMHAVCPAQLTPLDMLTLITVSEYYKI